jgi:hypothetical protein
MFESTKSTLFIVGIIVLLVIAYTGFPAIFVK